MLESACVADCNSEFGTGQVVPGTSYRVISLIGQGGMGSVYEVEHAELGKRFVLKALLSDLINRDDLVQRLRNEWRSLGQLEHPNIVSVTDAGVSANGVPYYVMERLLGETLGSRLRHGAAFHLTEALQVAAEILDGLQAAHEIGVVHRDVKPPNIFLMQNKQAKLLDFGIAKLLDRDAMELTGRGVAIGTPRYMSPEQASGESVDGRADLYAVGLVLFEMLAGQGPFEGARNSEVFFAHLTKTPPALSSLVGGIPAEVDRFVAKLLCKQPSDRPNSAGVAAVALRSMIRSYGNQPLRDTVAGAMSGVLTPVVSAVPEPPGAPEMPLGRISSSRITEKVHSTTISESGPTSAGGFHGLTAESPGASVAAPKMALTASEGSASDAAWHLSSARFQTERINPFELVVPVGDFTQAPPTRTAAPIPVTPPSARPLSSVLPPASVFEAPSRRKLFVLVGMSALATGAFAAGAVFLSAAPANEIGGGHPSVEQEQAEQAPQATPQSEAAQAVGSRADTTPGAPQAVASSPSLPARGAPTVPIAPLKPTPSKPPAPSANPTSSPTVVEKPPTQPAPALKAATSDLVDWEDAANESNVASPAASSAPRTGEPTVATRAKAVSVERRTSKPRLPGSGLPGN